MRRNPKLQKAVGALLVAAWSSAIGCTHNHYYNTAGVQCPPGTVVVGEPASAYGAVCDVNEGSTTITTRSPSGSGSKVTQVPIVNSTARPKIVTSEPAGSGYSRSGTKLGWRRSDPENLANVKVEGAYDESINR